MNLVETRRRVSVTPVAWTAEAKLALAEWLDQGQKIGRMGRSAGWWIGDWLRYGNERWGEKYSRATKITGYDAQTLMNMVYVASRFEISRRRENLSWSHHAEVAALDPEDQALWLERAEADRFSVRDLRDAIRMARRRPAGLDDGEPLPSGPREVVEPAVVTCPECGHNFHAG